MQLALTLPMAVSIACGAADYPSVKPIRMVVPFAPGGSSDVVGRLIGTKMAVSLKQTIIVDNRAGAGGMIGSDIVAKAAPDGYTLLLVDALHIVSPLFSRNTLYDPIKDFTPVAMIAKSPLFLATHPNFEAKTLPAMLAYARREPGRVAVGIPGAGNIVIEMLKLRAKVNFNLVPYKGGAPAVNDLVAGNIQLMTGSIATYGGFVKAGRLRLLATTGLTRHADYPDVPTFAETGTPGVDYEQWFGMLAPAKMPQPVSAKLGTAIADAIKEPDVSSRFSLLALDPFFLGPREFNARVLSDNARWKKVAEDAGIKPAD
jgi:tripartite-type tricarboxylate transporter receptor subunit TctC